MLTLEKRREGYKICLYAILSTFLEKLKLFQNFKFMQKNKCLGGSQENIVNLNYIIWFLKM